MQEQEPENYYFFFLSKTSPCSIHQSSCELYLFFIYLAHRFCLQKTHWPCAHMHMTALTAQCCHTGWQGSARTNLFESWLEITYFLWRKCLLLLSESDLSLRRRKHQLVPCGCWRLMFTSVSSETSPFNGRSDISPQLRSHLHLEGNLHYRNSGKCHHILL